MKHSFKLALLFLLTGLLSLSLLTGCGGSSSSSGGWSGTGYTVSGILTETDGVTPIQGATVDLNTRARNFQSARAQVISGADGSFRFTGQTAGNYTLRFSKTGYVALNMLLTVNKNLTDINPILVVVEQWATFTGDDEHPYNAESGYIMVQALRQDNDVPIAGVSIDTTGAYDERGYLTEDSPVTVSWANTVTNDNGVAFFYNTNDETAYTFTAAKDEYTFSNLTGVTAIPGEIVFAPIYATAYPDLYTFSGRVEEIDETGIVSARVSIVGASFNAGVDTNALGEFAISEIPAGDYRVRITKNNYRPTRSNITIDQNQNDLRYPLLQTAIFDAYHPTGVNLILLRGENASSREAIPYGYAEIASPATHTDIGVFPGSNTSMDSLCSSRTYANGYQLFYDVNDGGDDIAYTYEKRNYVFADGTVPASELAAGEVYFAVDRATTVPESFTIVATVRDAQGTAVPDVRVDVQGTAVNATSNAQGQVTLNNVPAGKQLFVVNRNSYNATYAKCDSYFYVSENIELSDGLRFTCFTQAQMNAVLGGEHPYHPSGADGYLAVWGEIPSQNGVGIPKTVISTTGGSWDDQGYITDDAVTQVSWSATFAYNNPAIKVFYEGAPATYTLTVNPSVYNPGWEFPGGETAQVFAGEITMLGVKALNYPTRTVSGILHDGEDVDVAGASVVVCRNDDDYDSAALYRATTDESGAFTITDLPAYFQYTLDMVPGEYLRTYAGFELFSDYDNAVFHTLTTAQFNTLTGGGAHAYDLTHRYITALYLNSSNQPVGSVAADFSPVPGAGNLGYMNDSSVIDWSAASTYASQGLAMDYGIDHDTTVTVSGTHATLIFRSLGSWHWINDGALSELLMRAYTH